MSQYYTSGDILAQKKNGTNTATEKKLAEDFLADKGYERQVTPRKINGGRDRVPQNHAQKNKIRLNSSLASTPAQARNVVTKPQTSKKRAPSKLMILKNSIKDAMKSGEDTKVVFKKESAKTPFPIPYILCILLMTVIFLYVIHLYIEIDNLNATLTEYNNAIVEMKSEQKSLTVKRDSKFDLEEIEKIARERYGMVPADQLPKSYITSENGDSIEIVDNGNENETPGALMSGFARVVSNLLSYIN
ncbi:MAG: hypothetical protein E7582_06620 [Ruminococcaceae bacterium]|nr:hypothetical protein [Oscillospiraceae bacterium]